MKISQDNLMHFKEGDFKQCTSSEQKVRLGFNGKVIIIFLPYENILLSL